MLSSSEKFGLDKELAEKRLSKYDKKAETDAVRWIHQVTGQDLGNDFWQGLKSGVVLCKLINNIKPGIIPSFVENPKHWLEEKANINKFLQACTKIGVSSQDLCSELDFSESRKDITAILQNIFGLARQAQAIGWNGPRLGVRYYRTEEDQKKQQEKKHIERVLSDQQIRKKREDQEIRRLELEAQADNQFEEELESDRSKQIKRQSIRAQLGRTKSLGSFREPISPRLKPTSIKYGYDLELQQRRREKYDEDLEHAVLNWLEDLTEEEIDDLWGCLKSGRIICLAVNKLQPNIVPRINQTGNAYRERENIHLFLAACTKLGVPDMDLFNINDLYERENLNTVLHCLYSLSRVMENRPSYSGPLVSHHFATTPRKLLESANNLTDDNNNNKGNNKDNDDPLGIKVTKKRYEYLESLSDSDTNPELEVGEGIELIDMGGTGGGRDGGGATPSPSASPAPSPSSTRRHDLSDLETSLSSKVTSSTASDKTCWDQLVVRGFASLVVFVFVVVVCGGGGNFGNYFLRSYFFESTSIFRDRCNDTYCIGLEFEKMFQMGVIMSFLCFTLAGVMLEFWGPKITCWVGLLWKVISLILFAFGDSSSSITFYSAYIFFQAGGPFVALSAIIVAVDFPKTTLIATTIVGLHFFGGSSVLFAVFTLNLLSWKFFFVACGGASLAFVFLATLLFWPFKKGYGKYRKKQRNSVSAACHRQYFENIKSKIGIKFIYILLFLVVLVINSNYLLNQFTNLINNVQDAIWIKSTNQMGIIPTSEDSSYRNSFVVAFLSFLPLLAIFFSFTAGQLRYHQHLTIVLSCILLASLLGLLPDDIALFHLLRFVRFLLVGVYYPYGLGFFMSFVVRHIRWETFGIVYGFSMFVAGLMNVVFMVLLGASTGSVAGAVEGNAARLSEWAVNLTFLTVCSLLLIYPVFMIVKDWKATRKEEVRKMNA